MILIAASPTGGHIYPAIAIAQELADKMGLPGNAKIITAKSPTGSEIVSRYGIPLSCLPKNIRNPFIFLWSFLKSLYLLKNTTVLLCTGGYLTVPVALAAKCMRIPFMLLEQNVIPGRANRLLERFAKQIFVSFEETKPYLCSQKVHVTGNPVRKTFADDPFTDILERFGTSPCLLVFGGSQGAQKLNHWIQEHYDYFLTHSASLIHITGVRDYEACRQAHPPSPSHPGYHTLNDDAKNPKILILPYVERMDLIYQKASLVLCRAGATSIAELMAFQVPGILVPYPHATDQHQVLNAQSICAMGLADMMPEEQLNFDRVSLKLQETCHSNQHTHTSAREAIVRHLF